MISASVISDSVEAALDVHSVLRLARIVLDQLSQLHNAPHNQRICDIIRTMELIEPRIELVLDTFQEFENYRGAEDERADKR